METIVVIGCPSCGRRYRYDTRRFGTSGVRVRCRSCETIMMVRVQQDVLQDPGNAEHDAVRATMAPRDPVSESSASVDVPGDEVVDRDEDPSRVTVSVPDAVTSPAPGEGVPREVAAPVATREEMGPDEGRMPDGQEVPEVGTEAPGALVADRDADRRALFAEILRKEGYRILAATDGVEARQVLAVERPRVALLNAFLPGVLGVTLCSEIKRHPELCRIHVILVGSQYRRDRFIRNPGELYGADDFLDGSGDSEAVLREALEILSRVEPVHADAPTENRDERGELQRLARIIAGDIILYNPTTAETEIAAGRFFETFSEEIREGESLVARRFPEVDDRNTVFHATLREAITEHGISAGIPMVGQARDH